MTQVRANSDGFVKCPLKSPTWISVWTPPVVLLQCMETRTSKALILFDRKNWECTCAYAFPLLWDKLHWPVWGWASVSEPLLKFGWQTLSAAECEWDEEGWVGVCRKAAYIHWEHVTHACLPLYVRHTDLIFLPYWGSDIKSASCNFCEPKTQLGNTNTSGCKAASFHSLFVCVVPFSTLNVL